MPTTIVAATCPLPPCNLAPRDLESLVADLESYADHFLPDFPRKDQAPWAHRYLQGLLSDLARKSPEPMALALAFPRKQYASFHWRKSLAHRCTPASSSAAGGPDLGRARCGHLGRRVGYAQARPALGKVAPQYCRALGKVANCQAGVFVGYASRKGYTLLAGQLFVPEASFGDDHAALREAVGMPAELTFQTKPQWPSSWCARS